MDQEFVLLINKCAYLFLLLQLTLIGGKSVFYRRPNLHVYLLSLLLWRFQSMTRAFVFFRRLWLRTGRRFTNWSDHNRIRFIVFCVLGFWVIVLEGISGFARALVCLGSSLLRFPMNYFDLLKVQGNLFLILLLVWRLDSFMSSYLNLLGHRVYFTQYSPVVLLSRLGDCTLWIRLIRVFTLIHLIMRNSFGKCIFK